MKKFEINPELVELAELAGVSRTELLAVVSLDKSMPVERHSSVFQQLKNVDEGDALDALLDIDQDRYGQYVCELRINNGRH